MVSPSPQTKDVYSVSSARKSNASSFDSEKFVRQKPSSLLELGKPLLKLETTITDLEEGESEVFASGVEKTWEGMPSDHERTCFFTARGLLFTKEEHEDISPLLFSLIANPDIHPKIFTGVEGSKFIREFSAPPPELLHVYNLQSGGEMQYMTEMVVRDIGYGFVVTQKSLNNIEERLKPGQLFPNRRTDLMKNYIAQIQVLKVANGTVIVMEMRAYVARVPASCSTAADTWPLPDFLGGDRGVKQRMEQWLTNLHRMATDEPFMEAMLR